MEGIKLSKVLQDELLRKILFFIFHSDKNICFYLKMDEKEFLSKLQILIDLRLVREDKLQLTKRGLEVLKPDFLFLKTFFELVDLFLSNSDFREYFIEKSSLPCVYYDVLSRAVKPFLYFIHLYASNCNESCSLKKRDMQSVLNHRNCPVCSLILLALEQDEIVRPVIKALR